MALGGNAQATPVDSHELCFFVFFLESSLGGNPQKFTFTNCQRSFFWQDSIHLCQCLKSILGIEITPKTKESIRNPY